MKKQLFTLALLTLGYVASSHSMGVAVVAHLTKLKTNVAADTTQTVNAKAMWFEDEKPVIAGQPVLEIEETKPGTWLVKHVNPGTAMLHIRKKNPGYSHGHEKGHHKCKGALITVTGTATATDEGIVVDEIEMGSETRQPDMEIHSEVNAPTMGDVE